jgi:hypothetical protein
LLYLGLGFGGIDSLSSPPGTSSKKTVKRSRSWKLVPHVGHWLNRCRHFQLDESMVTNEGVRRVAKRGDSLWTCICCSGIAARRG